jgi:2',3'-cyclic-nucleotide 2'-phosphodiesterase (5'-nucleotidase family)
MTGEQILAVLEQSLTLERGMLQVSGLRVGYDLSQPVGNRVMSVQVNEVDLKLEQLYRVSTVEIMAQGGDLFTTFRKATRIERPDIRFSEVLAERLREIDTLVIPKRGRLLPYS